MKVGMLKKYGDVFYISIWDLKKITLFKVRKYSLHPVHSKIAPAF
jgi:hypothetical protein